MEDTQKTRGLLIAELQALRVRHERAIKLLQTAEYAFTKLPFDHASRRGCLADIRRLLEADGR